MLLLRSMPDLSTPAAREAYHRIAAERGAIVCATTRKAVYGTHSEQLSLKAAFGGSEDYFIDGSRRAVDDDVYLIINKGHPYESRLHSSRPVQSVAIVFSDAMCEALSRDDARPGGPDDLDSSPGAAGAAELFAEHLRPHDRLVTPLVRYLVSMVQAELAQPEWCEEQAYFLLGRMSSKSRNDRSQIARLPFVRRRTRMEIHRRIHRATDFLLSSYAEPLSLARLAEVACLGRFHFLRMFRAVHGVTPFQFQACKRVAVAARLLARTSLPLEGIAAMAGYGGADRLVREFRRLTRTSPSRFRRESKAAADLEAALKDVGLAGLLKRMAGARPVSGRPPGSAGTPPAA